ncbi:phosphatidylinositol N-acetylglucosaminyltransferase subunit P isoform X3 [Raphanus sativus]|uniref:Phosphatidylinositol N-acetylglucosaminyltransferase subunit P isoform X3 n=1 Tax=Raphanus sativus TaxID=3726 RepID=A0A9W3C0J1_RAPSA|nr:phosphatidylinositol N-acetylglucosaminyltransferase subunit P isoform X3 [Raphanus sativus]
MCNRFAETFDKIEIRSGVQVSLANCSLLLIAVAIPTKIIFPSRRKFLLVISQSTLFLQNMEEAHSVNSPRRVLSFSKRRKQKPFGFQDSDSISSSTLRASQVHGPKPSEVYGFVGSISTVVATVIFLIWAYVPDKLLESIGIHYYPSRYWVLAMPTYLMVTLLLGLAFYVGLNFIATPHPTSLSTLFDEYSREPGEIDSQMEEGDERPIDPISDIDITRINDLMFNSK